MAQPHPLALLGDVIAGAGAQYAANAQRRQTREEQLADIAAARAFEQDQARQLREHQATQAQKERDFQTDFRKGGWDQEKTIYEARRYDAVKNELIRAGHLKKEEAGDEAAFQAALNKGGQEYQLNLDEIAKAKAAIQTIIDKSEAKPELIARLRQVLKMKPDQIDEVREIMGEGYAAVGEIVERDAKLKINNEKNGALLMATHIAKIGQLDNERGKTKATIDRLIEQRYTPKEEELIQKTGRAMLDPEWQKEYDDGAPSDEAKAELARVRDKAIEKAIGPQVNALMQRSKSLDDEVIRGHGLLQTISLAVSKNIAGHMDPKLFGIAAEPPADLAEKPPPRRGAIEDFDKTLGGGGPVRGPVHGPPLPEELQRGPIHGPPLPGSTNVAAVTPSLWSEMRSAYDAQVGRNAPPAGISREAADAPSWLQEARSAYAAQAAKNAAAAAAAPAPAPIPLPVPTAAARAPLSPGVITPTTAVPTAAMRAAPTAFGPSFLERLGEPVGRSTIGGMSGAPMSEATLRAIQQPIDAEYNRIKSIYGNKVVNPTVVQNLMRSSLQNVLGSGRYVTPFEKEVALKRVQEHLNEQPAPMGLAQ